MQALEELKKDLERVGEAVDIPAGNGEDRMTEKDFLEAFEAARENDQAVIMRLNEELDLERGKVRILEAKNAKQMAETDAAIKELRATNEALSGDLEKAQIDLRAAKSNAAKYRSVACTLQRQLTEEIHSREVDGKKYESEVARIREHVRKPIKWPLIISIAFAVLSVLVGVWTDRCLMLDILGTPVAAGCLAVCALFAGVVYERCRLR